MTNRNLPRPTRQDYDKLLQLEKRHNWSDRHIDWLNSFDWSAEAFEENGRRGLKSAIGDILLPAEFEDFKLLTGAVLHHGDRITTKQGGLWGVIIADGKGTWLVEPRYDYIGYPNTLTQACLKNQWGVLNILTAEFLITLECDSVHTHNGSMFCCSTGTYEKQGKIGILFENGSFTQAMFDEVDLSAAKPLRVKRNGKWGFLNESGHFTSDELSMPAKPDKQQND